MTKGEGAQPDKVIKDVKKALAAAEIEAGKNGLGFKLDTVTVELSVVQTRDSTGGFSLKIPWLEWELGGSRKISKEQTQTLAVTLKTPKAESDVASDNLNASLATSFVDIAKFVWAGKDQDLELAEASVEIQFAVTKSGELKLVEFAGKREDVTTHKLTVKLLAA